MNALHPSLTRRQSLLGLAAAFTLGGTSLAFAAPFPQAWTDKRLVVIILRGALDGLSAVQPYGDPNCAAIRGILALPEPGQPDGLLDLGGTYGLHPSLANLHAMYQANDALLIHAVAGHYRSRSHFEAQDYLESGADQRLESGWLNRAVACLPQPSGHELALSMGLSAPLMMRGPARVQAYAPDHFAQPSDDLYARLLAITAPDKLIGPSLAEAIKERGFDTSTLAGMSEDTSHDRAFEVLTSAAGRLLAQPQGPRVAVLEIGGWDTHAGQPGKLKTVLAQLDAGLAALKTDLGPAWQQTAILAVTEFGRTAHINGTRGTDHGTAGVALLCGGAIAGGRIHTDWPGLGQGQLFENRDLAPTTDLRGVIKGVLGDHLGIRRAQFDKILPGSGDAEPVSGLVRT